MNLAAKYQKVRAEAAAYKDALHAALLAIHDLKLRAGAEGEADSLAKLITGYPPAKHTRLLYVPAGASARGPAYVLVRKEKGDR